jgi:NADH-quinone oxidoreductase subunit J
MSGEFIAFLVLALMAIAGGILMINLSQVVHMVLALVFSFISIAGIYVLLSAEFVAAVQILIYSGAVTIIMLFGIMLTRHHDQSEPSPSIGKKILVIGGIAIFAITMYFGIYNIDLAGQATDLHVENTKQIGIALYTKYIIPFELTSVVLLVALIGAIILAKGDDKKEANEE